MSSSERAHARGFDIKKTNHNASSHDVYAALRRVRNVQSKIVPTLTHVGDESGIPVDPGINDGSGFTPENGINPGGNSGDGGII